MAFKKIITLIATSVITFYSLAQKNAVPVFVSGTDGYKSFRIPAVIKAPDGDLLAFCEGRVNGAGDFGHVNIVMKRSTDKGKTWGRLQVIADYGELQAGNPAPVVDLTDPGFPGGRIFLFYNTGNNHEGEVRKGNGLREVWYKTSTDNGDTWSDAVNITLQVHRPKQPTMNPSYDFPEDWRSYANTPGHAMQFQNGKYKGRIFVAINHSAGNPQPHFADYMANGFYSDDHGKTFHISDNVEMPGGNEATAAELTDGRLMMNIRNQKGDVKARIVAISNDGGSKWDTVYFDKQLPDPVCEGSILSLGIKNKKMILAFCNAADTSQRNNLTLRISYDEGKTWKKNILIDKNPKPYENKNNDYTAYSDLVKLNKKTIGVLYEKANYAEIVFVAINWKKSNQ
ncbi:MAG: exo-alpha-sialidase [Chitinophagaceae bacterium]|nr:exo-alpha-sialidase [Chitinophagaceae bacterium]